MKDLALKWVNRMNDLKQIPILIANEMKSQTKTMLEELDQTKVEDTVTINETKLKRLNLQIELDKRIEIEKMLKKFHEEEKIDMLIGVDMKGMKHSLLQDMTKMDNLMKEALEKDPVSNEMLGIMMMSANNDEMASILYDIFKSQLGRKPILKDIQELHDNIFDILASKEVNNTISRMLHDLSKEDAYKILLEKDESGNTSLMTLAIQGNGSTLATMLTYFLVHNDKDKIDEMLHTKNASENTLPYLISHAKENLVASYGIILQLEKEIHSQGRNDEDGFMALHECFHTQHGSSIETVTALNALNNRKATKTNQVMKFTINLFFMSLLVPLGFWGYDVGTDAILCNSYYQVWDIEPDASYITSPFSNQTQVVTLADYPVQLSNKAKNFYSLVMPMIFQLFEAFRWAVIKGGCWIHIILIFPIWPVGMIIKNFVHQFKFMVSSGHERQKLEQIAMKAEIERGFAHLLEVCLESSFQPLLQWYLLFPSVISIIENMEVNIEILSFSSWFASLLSLAWSFTAYNAALKKGAISIQANFMGRILVFLSNLLLIFARMNCIVLFMYYWGPGQFYQGVILIVCHAFLMGLLHLLLTNSRASIKNQTKTNLTCYMYTIYSFLLNGLANIFNHNYVQICGLDEQGKVNTFSRQVIFDTIFLVENFIMAVFGCLIPVRLSSKSHNAFVILLIFALHFIGLFLKVVYYKGRVKKSIPKGFMLL